MRKRRRLLIRFVLILAGIFSLTVLVATVWPATARPVAAQVVPGPLSLTVTLEPPTPVSGDQLTFWFDVQNVSDAAVKKVQFDVTLPEGTLFQTSAADDEAWSTFTLGEEMRTHIYYTVDELAAGAAARLSLTVLVEQTGGQSIVLDIYVLTAQGLESPIAGESITVLVAEATPPVVHTPTWTPTATSTPTPQPTTTPIPSPTPSPSPSPTVTVVMAELPPTPTPKLSSEQEQLGALTVSIFVFLTLSIALVAAVWLFRKRREG